MKRKRPTHGGARSGAGRKAPQGAGKSFTVYLTPPEQAKALRHGKTVQRGIRALIAGA